MGRKGCAGFVEQPEENELRDQASNPFLFLNSALNRQDEPHQTTLSQAFLESLVHLAELLVERRFNQKPALSHPPWASTLPMMTLHLIGLTGVSLLHTSDLYKGREVTSQ